MRSKFVVFALIVTVLGILALGIPCYLDARIPRATAVIQVHPHVLINHSSNYSGPLTTRSYMESEFEKILSLEVLERAAKSLISLAPENQDDAQTLEEISTTKTRRGS